MLTGYKLLGLPFTGPSQWVVFRYMHYRVLADGDASSCSIQYEGGFVYFVRPCTAASSGFWGSFLVNFRGLVFDLESC